MTYDDYKRCIFTSDELFNSIYEHGIDVLQNTIVNDDSEIQKFNQNNNNLLLTSNLLPNVDSIESFDAYNHQIWFMPEDYINFDIEGYLHYVCPKQNYQRLIDELNEFKSRNMLNLLRWLKYLVDNLRKEGILWGVGRGSSVSSYVLYLIGVHKIDSIKYKLDYKDFLR